MTEDIPQRDYNVGDVLRVTCPATAARVVDAGPSHVFIHWRWRAIDPDSGFRWNGQVAVPTDPSSHEWSQLLFRVDPAPQHLTAGDACFVGIPETLVRVVEVIRHDPPIDLGWLPRPHVTLVVLPLDLPDATDEADADDDRGICIRLDSGEPVSLALHVS